MADLSGAPGGRAVAGPVGSQEWMRADVGVRRRLILALALSALLSLSWVVYLFVPQAFEASRPFLMMGIVCLGIFQLSILYRCLDRLRGRAGLPPDPAASATPSGRPATGEIGQGLQALLASGRADEVGTLMREFTRILEVLQQQASQVQDYGARFEIINEELRNANLRLREMSLTDELTEVGNRRNFDMRMREEINRSTRFGHAFSLLLLDIDAFKKFNDEFGHPQGDAVLRALGSLMRSMSREGDVPCRIGGEEFAFILPETAKADAMAFAERIRRGVEASIQAPGGTRALTVSVGLAAFPEDGKSPDDLVRAADEALYQSKREGRNRVTVFLRKG